VQITMISIGLARGERIRPGEWLGLLLAFAGLVYLMSPGLTAPSPTGVFLMSVAGAAWGYYSLRATGEHRPVAATAGTFIRAIPLAAGALAIVWASGQAHATWSGIGLAAICGAVTSGLGYALWYLALGQLRTSLAAVVQLSVPILTAAAGVILLGEQVTWRLAWASAAILGGAA
jgi:drug/metabolite transporter (DMT)-like permease